MTNEKRASHECAVPFWLAILILAQESLHTVLVVRRFVVYAVAVFSRVHIDLTTENLGDFP